MYPKVGTVFEYEDTDHEDWCSTSGTYKVTSVSDPNRFGQRVVAVEAINAANPTSGILNWEDQVNDGTIHCTDCGCVCIERYKFGTKGIIEDDD